MTGTGARAGTKGAQAETEARTETAGPVERAGKQDTGKKRKLVTDVPMPADTETRVKTGTATGDGRSGDKATVRTAGRQR